MGKEGKSTGACILERKRQGQRVKQVCVCGVGGDGSKSESRRRITLRVNKLASRMASQIRSIILL